MAEESVNTSVISGVTNNIYKVPDSVAIESAGSDPKLLWCCIFFFHYFLSILFNYYFFLNWKLDDWWLSSEPEYLSTVDDYYV